VDALGIISLVAAAEEGGDSDDVNDFKISPLLEVVLGGAREEELELPSPKVAAAAVIFSPPPPFDAMATGLGGMNRPSTDVAGRDVVTFSFAPDDDESPTPLPLRGDPFPIFFLRGIASDKQFPFPLEFGSGRCKAEDGGWNRFPSNNRADSPPALAAVVAGRFLGGSNVIPMLASLRLLAAAGAVVAVVVALVFPPAEGRTARAFLTSDGGVNFFSGTGCAAAVAAAAVVVVVAVAEDGGVNFSRPPPPLSLLRMDRTEPLLLLLLLLRGSRRGSGS